MFARAPQSSGSAAPPRDGKSPISPVSEVIEEIRRGRMIVLMDDEDRENEGDIVVAAEKCTVEHVNFMIRHARGLICMPITEDRMQKLGLRMMVPENTAPLGTGFTVSIDARSCTGGGVTAADRCRTIRLAADPDARASDFVIPGHIFPLRAREGGVLVRTGQTEGSIDLCRLAGLEAAGVICEILNEDGTMARLPDLVRFAETHGLKIS